MATGSSPERLATIVMATNANQMTNIALRRVEGRNFFETRSFELGTSSLFAICIPLAIMLREGAHLSLFFSALSNLGAVLLATHARSSLASFPGLSAGRAIIPTVMGAHFAMLFAVLMLRLPYSRSALLLGLIAHLLVVMIRFRATMRRRESIGILPVGRTDRLPDDPRIDWRPMNVPTIEEARRHGALVADLNGHVPHEWERFMTEAALQGIIIYQAKELTESLTGRVEPERLGENGFSTLMPARAWFHIKGLSDRIFAMVALILFALPMIVIAVLVRRDSPGPALFRQVRAGHAGAPFTAYKFRTMRMIDDDGNRSIKDAQTVDDDARITALGRTLRRTRLDELPQLINVLRGEMSLIGPRPEPKVLVDWYQDELPFYRLRHVVKPGITGWAQVNQGHVNGLDQAQVKLHYDFYYIKYFSPWLDVIILFRTIATMLGRKNVR